MTNTPDTRPTVSPIEGHYARLRNGIIAKIGEKKPTVDGLELFHSVHFNYRWFDTGKSYWDDGQYDIIATISPEAMNEAVAFSQQPSQFERMDRMTNDEPRPYHVTKGWRDGR